MAVSAGTLQRTLALHLQPSHALCSCARHSRTTASIVDEVQRLYDEGYREVVLLGQNVNSYHDEGTPSEYSSGYNTARGFSNMYKLRDGDGVRFTELLDRVSRCDVAADSACVLTRCVCVAAVRCVGLAVLCRTCASGTPRHTLRTSPMSCCT